MTELHCLTKQSTIVVCKTNADTSWFMVRYKCITCVLIYSQMIHQEPAAVIHTAAL